MPTALSRWWPSAEADADGLEATDVRSGENGPRPAPDALLEHIAPAPDGSEAVAALDAALKP